MKNLVVYLEMMGYYDNLFKQAEIEYCKVAAISISTSVSVITTLLFHLYPQ